MGQIGAKSAAWRLVSPCKHGSCDYCGKRVRVFKTPARRWALRGHREGVPRGKPCEACGVVLCRPDARWCSRRCRTLGTATTARVRACEVCGVEYVRVRGGQRCCGAVGLPAGRDVRLGLGEAHRACKPYRSRKRSSWSTTDPPTAPGTWCRRLPTSLTSRWFGARATREKGWPCAMDSRGPPPTSSFVQDADLEYNPSDYPKLLQPILDDHADVVFGSRPPHRAERAPRQSDDAGPSGD